MKSITTSMQFSVKSRRKSPDTANAAHLVVLARLEIHISCGIQVVGLLAPLGLAVDELLRGAVGASVD